MSYGFENVLGIPVNFPWSLAASIDKNDSAFHIDFKKRYWPRISLDIFEYGWILSIKGLI
jgi:hypothetical protein